MIFAPKFLALHLFFCLCNGAPPKEVGTSSNRRPYFRFTEEEDNFIINEVLDFPGNSPQVLGKNFWEYIFQKHREKWRQHTPGFPCERSFDTLRKHFSDTLIHNHPNAKVKVPESVFRRFPLLNKNRAQRAVPSVVTVLLARDRDLDHSRNGDITSRKAQQMALLSKGDTQSNRHAYSSEENELILKELSRPSCTALHSSSTWEAIQAKHDEKRKKKIRGFENKRNVESLRRHMTVLRHAGLLPDKVVKKLRTNGSAGSTSRSSPQGETFESQETNQNEEDVEWADSLITEPTDADEPDLS